ncbi:hypothetical protein BD410DRAFT_755231 [Rickenella mellea]|uniref:BTB domain-containing protein n=1 Tax=Rickenella mellea TaxID=50990 RepID=A0A4Y7PQC0_9AGAM|nr:hypothetical protein BD410DRAFT_755231 [Rickenella mellea]
MSEADHEQNTAIPLNDRTRHPNLWFEDGNIILATKFSVFLVHRGLLSWSSPVFADMLSMPQPDIMETTLDGLPGIPVVELSDDDEQFTHLLRFCYNARYYQQYMPTTFEIISALLRMSTKYQMDGLRSEIIAHLGVIYPVTIEKYVETGKPDTQLSLFPPFEGQHFAVSNLARETGALVLLPAALWKASCEPEHNISRGSVSGDGKKHQLDPLDVRKCLAIKLEYYSIYVKTSFTIPFRTPSLCVRSGREKCSKVALVLLGAHFAQTGPCDILLHWDSFDCWSNEVCAACMEVAASLFLQTRKYLWSCLPGRLDLPGWHIVASNDSQIPQA